MSSPAIFCAYGIVIGWWGHQPGGFRLAQGVLATDYMQKLNEKGIRCAVFGKDKVRMVTHLADLERRLVVS